MNIEDYIEDANTEEVKTFEIRATFKIVTTKEGGFDAETLDQILTDSSYLAEALENGTAEFTYDKFRAVEK
jgi:hypothetical protein